MKDITNEQFAIAFEGASDQVKNLMYSSTLFDLAQNYITINQLEVSASKTLLPIGYNLLGLLTSDETALALEEVGVKNGLRFLVEVKEEALKKEEIVQNTHETKAVVETPEQENSTVFASEIAEAEKDIENLQGIRTMAADMREAQTHHVPTHQSSQSDIFQSNTPTPPPQTGPQWETDK